MQDTERYELLCQIGKVSFTMDELRIFLDTHADCEAALERFDELAKERMDLICKFEKRYGPMNFYNNNNCSNEWRWVDAPWPWEGGC